MYPTAGYMPATSGQSGLQAALENYKKADAACLMTSLSGVLEVQPSL